MDDMRVGLITWNVQGSQGIDVAAVAAVIREQAPDVVALQEIQRRQAVRLAAALTMTSRRWAFKHWPVVNRAEGLAVLTPHRLTSAASFPLRRAPFWNWRRRIGLDAAIERDGSTFGVVDVHLSPHGAELRRDREAAVVLSRVTARERAPVICGDFNDQPGQAGYAAFLAAGWADAWVSVHGDGDPAAGATNWTAGVRLGRPPTQRIDYVLVPPGALVEHCDVLAASSRFDDFAALSDHLPLAATVRLVP
jgi:endonuclease/exonuclease/phosphatase family metal-dependent hydrolase